MEKILETSPPPIKVLCVDDNPHVLEALQIKLNQAGGFVWTGSAQSAGELLSSVEKLAPDIIVLDVDMPGKDSFIATEELSKKFPRSRVVIFSGHVGKELIDIAVNSGVWGYISKNDGEEALVKSLRRVAIGEFSLSPEARTAYDQR